MVSSVLTAIMTYANWRLSAEMRQFSKNMHVPPRMDGKVEENADGRVNCDRLTFAQQTSLFVERDTASLCCYVAQLNTSGDI